MAGVPNYLEIEFCGYDGERAVLTSSERDSLIGKTILIRISKNHYRFHEFEIKSVYGQNSDVTKLVLERKQQPKEGGDPQ